LVIGSPGLRKWLEDVASQAFQFYLPPKMHFDFEFALRGTQKVWPSGPQLLNLARNHATTTTCLLPLRGHRDGHMTLTGPDILRIILGVSVRGKSRLDCENGCVKRINLINVLRHF
jgi:hypothetical protein